MGFLGFSRRKGADSPAPAASTAPPAPHLSGDGPAEDEVNVSSVDEGMALAAEQFREAFRGEGSPVDADALDLSLASVALVDRVLGDFHTQQSELPEDLHFMASAYVFECVRTTYGGRYLRYTEQEPFILVVGEPDCEIAVAVMGKVAGRVVNGPEDDLGFFLAGIDDLLANKRSALLT